MYISKFSSKLHRCWPFKPQSGASRNLYTIQILILRLQVFQVLSQVLINVFYWNLCQSPEVSLPILRFHSRDEGSGMAVLIGLLSSYKVQDLPDVTQVFTAPTRAAVMK